MKRKLALTIVVACSLACLAGCGNDEQLDKLESRISTLETTVSELQTQNDELMSWYEGIQADEEAKEAAKPDFSKLAESAPEDGTVSVSDDGLSMTVDTDPLNISKYNSSEAFTFIQDVNAELGLPDSLYEKMLATRALDGRQTSDYDNVTVSWSYHPDNGLEVIYESK